MNPPIFIEIEAKYRVTDTSLVSRLQNRKTLGSQYQLGVPKRSEVTDIYMDTDDVRLLRAGYSLRLRQKGDKHVVTLKAVESSLDQQPQSAINARYELERPVDKAITVPPGGLKLKKKSLPDDVLTAVLQLIGKKSRLSPLCLIKQTRHERSIMDKRTGALALSTSPAIEPASSPPASVEGDSRPLAGQNTDNNGHAPSQVAMLSIDEVAVFRDTTHAAEGSLPVYTFAEVEAELLPGYEVDALAPITQMLDELKGLEPEQESKFVCALLAMSQQMPIASNADEQAGEGTIHATTPVAEALRHIWRQQVTQLFLLEAGVHSDEDIEYVHKMRVAIRRMRAAYLLPGEFFAAKTIDPLIADLKKMAKILGKVRDLDVALLKLDRYNEQVKAEFAADRAAIGETSDKAQAASPSDAFDELQPLIDYWQAERAQCFTELVAALDSKAYRHLLTTLHEFVTTPELGVKERFSHVGHSAEPSQIRHVLPSVLMDRFLAVRKYEALFERNIVDAVVDGQREGEVPNERSPIDIETLHALRIECKNLRYVLEFTPGLLGEEGEHFIHAMKKLQDLLGDLNDASTAKEMLLALPKKVTNKAVKRYTKRQDKLIHKVEKRVADVLRTFLAEENRATLGTMIGRL